MVEEGENQEMDGVQEDQDEAAKPTQKNWADLSEEMKENINDTFDIFDKNKEDKVDRPSLGPILRWLGFNPTDRELKKYSSDYDKLGNGFFTKENVYDIVSKKQHEPDTLHEFVEACNLLDNDADGKIPVTELRWALT